MMMMGLKMLDMVVIMVMDMVETIRHGGDDKNVKDTNKFLKAHFASCFDNYFT